jgi:hypothetical protein
MGRRQGPHPTRKRSDEADGAGRFPFDDWIRWRPRPKPVFLSLSVLLLLVWVGFLLAMIYRQ